MPSLGDMQSPAVTSRRELDRRIITLAIPALGTLAIEPIYVLVDTAIVGRLGTPQLGGLAIASTILLTVISLTASLEYGVTPDVAFAHGAGRVRRGPRRGHRGAAPGGDDRRCRWAQSVAVLAHPLALAARAVAAMCWSTPSRTCASAASGCPSC